MLDDGQAADLGGHPRRRRFEADRPAAETRRDPLEPPHLPALEAGWAAVRRRLQRGVVVPTGVLVALITLIGVRLTRRLYGPGLAQGDDVPYHLARNAFAYQQIFAHGHLDGWAPTFSGGSQLFLLYGPGLAMVSAMARLLTLGQVSNATLLSVIAAAGYVATAPAMYVLARALRLSPIGAAVSGVMSLGVSVIFGVGPAGTFESGLVPHQVCVPFFLVALAGMVHLVERRSRRWLAITVASVVFITVTHSPSVQVLVVASALLLVLGLPRGRLTASGAWRLGLAAVTSVGLAAWYWAPLAAESGPRPPLASWGTEPFATRLHDMATGKDWANPAIAAVAMVAVAVVVVRLVSTAREQQWLGRWAWSTALTGPILLGSVQLLHNRLGGDVGVSIATRGLGYSGILCMLPLGAVVDLVGNSRGVGRRMSRVRLRPGHVALVAVACAPILMGYVPAANHLAKAHAPAPVLVAAATTLEQLMEPKDEFVWVNEAGFDQSFGPVHPDLWLTSVTGHSAMGGLGGDAVTTIDTYAPAGLSAMTPAAVTALLDRAGVSVMLAQTSTAARIAAPSDWRVVSSHDNLTILQRTRVNQLAVPAAGSDVSLVLTHWSDEQLEWHVMSGTGAAVLALPRLPTWSVRIDGRRAPTVAEDGYLRVAIPPGASQVTARFHRSDAAGGGLLLSLLSMLGLAYVLWPVGRRRRTDVRRAPPQPAVGRDPVVTWPELVASLAPSEPVDEQDGEPRSPVVPSPSASP